MKNEVNIIDKYRKEIIIRQRNNDFSLCGKTGECFINGNKIIKLYKYPRKYDKNYDFTIYKSNRISFPIDYLYEKGMIIGEVMPYFNAEKIKNSLNLRSNIEFLMESCKEVEDEIKRFPNITMYDICAENVLYSSRKGMYIIDTYDWHINDNIYNIDYNIEHLEKALLFVLKEVITNNEYRNRIIDDSLMKYLYNYISEGNCFFELLREYQKNLRINYNYEIKNVSDVKKYIKIMKIS